MPSSFLIKCLEASISKGKEWYLLQNCLKVYGSKSCKEDSFQFSRCLPNTFAYGRMHFTSYILADGGGVVMLQVAQYNYQILLHLAKKGLISKDNC